jgi:hypothetical protein
LCLSQKFMNLWSFEIATSLFDDKFLEKHHFFCAFFFHQNHQKINKCWFLWQSLRQIFSWGPKVPCLRILWSYDYFWVNEDILNLRKKHVTKKKGFKPQKSREKKFTWNMHKNDKEVSEPDFWFKTIFNIFFLIQNILIGSKRVVQP